MEFKKFLSLLEDQGMIVKIDEEVDWDLEAGAIMRYSNEVGGPGLWFTRVKGAMPGASLAANLYSTFPRVALAYGLSSATSYHELVDWFAKSFTGRMKPVIVEKGRCQEHVLTGKEIDLRKLPAPKTHPSDGGRYIGTLSVGVCKDPDSDWVNWGNYRTMVHDQKSAGMLLSPANHGGTILRKYHSRGQRMEFAQFHGGDPLCTAIAAAGVPYGTSEVEVVGAMRGRPVELVKCKTVGLYVPADAELVIEGYFEPGELKDEGPFGEYPGYVVSEVYPRPVFQVTAVTFQSDPVLSSCCLGFPTDMLLSNLSVAASVKQSLIAAGLPIVKVGIPVASNRQALAVSTHTPLAGIAQRIGNVVWSDRNASSIPYLFVVNTDIDPMDLNAVFHALVSKCNPATAIHTFPGAFNTPLTPYVPKGPFKERGYGGGNALFDCTWPITWKPEEIPERQGFEETFAVELRNKVIANAKRWGLERPAR